MGRITENKLGSYGYKGDETLEKWNGEKTR